MDRAYNELSFSRVDEARKIAATKDQLRAILLFTTGPNSGADVNRPGGTITAELTSQLVHNLEIVEQPPQRRL